MQKLIEVKIEHTFEVDPDSLFSAWLNPEAVRHWMRMALQAMGLAGDVRRIEIDARKGGAFTFSDMREAGEAIHWGTYNEIVAPRKLVFSWFTSSEDEAANTSLVTLEIQPQEAGCSARITHQLDAAYAEYIAQTETGWSTMLVHSASSI